MARYKRSEIIEDAHRKIGVVHQVADLRPEWMARGVRYLNAILREESSVARNMAFLWASVDHHLPIREGRWIYTSTETFPVDVEDITSAVYRGTDGEDAPLIPINQHDYNAIEDKGLVGDPEKVYFVTDVNRTLQRVYLWPVGPEEPTVHDCVTGSNGQPYFCIREHTSEAKFRPTSGPQYEQYWAPGTVGTPATWVTATEYTSGELLRFTYRRKLDEMSNPSDNPDMPDGWDRFLIFRLAHDLAADFTISLEERAWLKGEYEQARQMLFPGSNPTHRDVHNKACYF